MDNKKVNATKLLFDSIRAEKKDLFVVVIFAIVIGLLYLITPLAVQELVNIIAFGVVLQPLFILTALVACGLLLVGAFRVFQRYLVEIIQQRLFVKTAFDIIGRIKVIQKDALGNKEINLFFEVLSLQKSYSKLLVDGLSAVLQALIGFILLGLYHPYFLLLDLFLIFGIFLSIVLGGRGGLKTSISESHYKYDLLYWLQQAGFCHDAFKLLGNNKFLNEKTDAINLKYLKARSAHFKILIQQNVLSLILQTVASGGLLALGGWLVIQGDLTLGQLIAAELVVTAILAAIDKFVGQIETVYDLLTALVKLDSLKKLPTISAQGNKALSLKQEGLKLECKNLHFNYENNEILKKINLNVQSGEWLNIRGPRGSGKTTLLNLVSGLYKPTKGSIYFDDFEIKEIANTSLGEVVGLVSGGRKLIFEATLADNILLGRSEKIPLRKILEISYLDELIDNSVAGLNSIIANQGLNLSESQVSCLLLARALVSNPRLLLIDEDTFAILETELKENIFNNLAEKLPFKPTLIYFGKNDFRMEKKYCLQAGMLVD